MPNDDTGGWPDADKPGEPPPTDTSDMGALQACIAASAYAKEPDA